MKEMRQFLIALVVVWTAACIAAYVYSTRQAIPARLAVALLPAFLAELAFYLAPGFQAVRKYFERLGPKSVRAGLLTASAAVPYVLAATALHAFRFPALAMLVVFAGIASFWYAVLKRGPVADFFFLVFMGAVYISRVFGWIYPHATPRLSLEIMGHLMWVRVGILAVLSIRGFENIRFGFLPSKADWRIGIQLYLLFLPVAGLAAYALHSLHFRVLSIAWWQYAALIVGTFAGMLWVVAMGEEFFFRGFLQGLLTKGLRSEAIALVIASAAFGLVHLPFRYFPNWRMVALTAILGLFCGLAFLRARSVRAAMVTHALVATTFRLFFTT
jgi:membrane protease YdiL (CAAX protease family)